MASICEPVQMNYFVLLKKEEFEGLFILFFLKLNMKYFNREYKIIAIF